MFSHQRTNRPSSACSTSIRATRCCQRSVRPVDRRPRRLDPRVGFFGITFKDYSQPIQGSLEQRWIARHRLERVNPNDPNSPFRKPIIYYIDSFIPCTNTFIILIITWVQRRLIPDEKADRL